MTTVGPFNTSVFNGVSMEPELTPMKTGKAGGWLGSYHWVSLPITDQNKHLDRIGPPTDWCNEYFGKSGSRWFTKEQKFFFKSEKDMSMFILRWAS